MVELEVHNDLMTELHHIPRNSCPAKWNQQIRGDARLWNQHRRSPSGSGACRSGQAVDFRMVITAAQAKDASLRWRPTSSRHPNTNRSIDPREGARLSGYNPATKLLISRAPADGDMTCLST